MRLTPAHVRPIASDDIAAIVTDTALAQPLNGTFDAAGPEKVGLAELVRGYLAARCDKRTVVADREAAYYGAILNDQLLTPIGDARISPTHFTA